MGLTHQVFRLISSPLYLMYNHCPKQNTSMQFIAKPVEFPCDSYVINVLDYLSGGGLSHMKKELHLVSLISSVADLFTETKVFIVTLDYFSIECLVFYLAC